MSNRRKGKGNGSPSDSISAMSSCNLPEDLIVEILSRLPVKSLLRFKSVSKPWLALIKDTKFISLHFNSTAMNPKNDGVIIHSLSLWQDNIMSLFNVNSIVNKPINLDHPFPEILRRMDLVGSYNGLVCLCRPPLGQMIILWNPAMRLYKVIELSSRNEDSDDIYKVSVGFGFDPVANDYKIIRIIRLEPKPPKERIRVKVEVYSAKKDCWKMIQVETPFFIIHSRCNAILKGIPYWTGFIIDEDGGCVLREVLVYFDPQNEVFRLWPVPEYPGVIISRVTELRNGLALLVYSSGEESCKYVDVLMQDYSKEGLIKRIGPIPFKVVRLIECSKNGEILAESTEGKLFLYDPKTNRVRDILIDDAQALSYEAISYTESLVSIEGMKQVGMEP